MLREIGKVLRKRVEAVEVLQRRGVVLRKKGGCIGNLENLAEMERNLAQMKWNLAETEENLAEMKPNLAETSINLAESLNPF